MRMLFNHGLSIPELYVNTPERVIDKKWRWFVKYYGSTSSYGDAVSDPFKYALGLIFNKILDERKRFKIPYAIQAYIDFETVSDEDFEKQRQQGRFQEIDFIGSDFTGYGIKYFYKGKAYQMSKPVYIGGALKQKFLEGINSGIRYYSIEDFELKELYPQIFEKFPELTHKEITSILAHGFRRLHSAIRQSCYVTLNTTKYTNCYVYIGEISLEPAKQIIKYSLQRDKKLRLIERWKKTPFDGYYYIGLTSERLQEWAKTNKNARILVNFANVFPRKIMEELFYKNKTVFIFRIKLKKFKGWAFWAEKITARDIMYMGEVDSLKFIPATKTWKEIIKEYETK